jgi:hypothetical protein
MGRNSRAKNHPGSAGTQAHITFVSRGASVREALARASEINNIFDVHSNYTVQVDNSERTKGFHRVTRSQHHALKERSAKVIYSQLVTNTTPALPVSSAAKAEIVAPLAALQIKVTPIVGFVLPCGCTGGIPTDQKKKQVNGKE